MTKQAFLRAFTVTCGLLVFAGCKSETARDVKKGPVVVLDYGGAARRPLRYEIQDGSMTTSTLELSTSSMTTTTRDGEELTNAPTLRFVVASGPAIKLPTGNVRLDVRIVDAEAVVPPGFNPEVERDFNQSVALLREVGGWIEVDDRGNTIRSELNQAAKNPNVPTRMLMTIVQARTSLARVVFPAESVGMGAVWEARQQLKLYGFEIQRTDRYTLIDRNADEVKLKVDIIHTAPEQTLTFVEEGVEFALKSLSTTARGEVDLNLNALEGSARVEGRSAEVLTVKTDESTEKIELDSAFQLNMDVSYEAPQRPDPG
ncbi:MAG: hypothetical protein WBB42_00895 [Polyangiales bacterium]